MKFNENGELACEYTGTGQYCVSLFILVIVVSRRSVTKVPVVAPHLATLAIVVE